jgi:hypothetical protein
MSDQKSQPGTIGKTFKLFLVIFVMLLVPMVMDQAEMDRETVKMAGRVAAGLTGILFLYGIFTKMLKGLVFVVLLLLVGAVVLVSEGQIKAPRVFGSSGK